MPGIVAVYGKRKDSALGNAELAEAMCRSMMHETWYGLDKAADYGVAAARISLGVLNPEPQPIYNEDRDLWIIMEGEIYDYAQLKNALIERGHRFHTSSDAEFLLHYYEENIEALPGAMRKLDGLFVALIYDRKERKVIILNDRYGLRPLYYCDRGSYWLLASEVKAILQDASFARTINLQAVADFFSFGYILGDKTFFEGIRLLPGASIVVLDGSRMLFQRYWNWTDIRKNTGIAYQEAVRELGRLWLRAVGRRLDDRRVGISLSGGLDSRAIAAAVPRERRPFWAVTFGKKGCLDERIAARVCHLLGLNHEVVELDPQTWYHYVERGVYLTDGQFNVVHNHAMNALYRAKSFFDIELNGYLGGNTVGGSYLDGLPRETGRVPYMGQLYGHLNEGGLAPGAQTRLFRSRYAELPELARQSLAEAFEGGGFTEETAECFIIQNRGLRFIREGTVVGQSVLENRKPFFDNDFIDFVYSLPDEWRRGSRLYGDMLTALFPEVFESIPWQKTGLPVTAGAIRKGVARYRRALLQRGTRLAERVGLRVPASQAMSITPTTGGGCGRIRL